MLSHKETTLGLKAETQTQDDPPFLKNTHNILSITAQRFFQPWIQPKYLFQLSTLYKTFRNSVHVLDQLLTEVYINQRVHKIPNKLI